MTWDVERVTAALRALREQGLEVRLEADAVILRVGHLEVACPASHDTLRRGPKNHGNTRVLVDGHELQNDLVALEVRLAVGEVNTAKLTLDLVP